MTPAELYHDCADHMNMRDWPVPAMPAYAAIRNARPRPLRTELANSRRINYAGKPILSSTESAIGVLCLGVGNSHLLASDVGFHSWRWLCEYGGGGRKPWTRRGCGPATRPVGAPPVDHRREPRLS